MQKEEVYKDFVRIPENHRLDNTGCVIEEGKNLQTECQWQMEISCLGGCEGFDGQEIFIDSKLRRELDLADGENYDFGLHRVGFMGDFNGLGEHLTLRTV